MDSEYYKGTYNASGVSYYDLTVAVLRDAGQTGYRAVHSRRKQTQKPSETSSKRLDLKL